MHIRPKASVALLTALIMTSTMVVPSMGWAQSTEEVNAKVEELSQKGAVHYRNGEYDQALSAFTEAYELSPVANLLYNIAKIWERKDDMQKAMEYYEKFIVAGDADPDVRAKALQRMKELRELADLKADDKTTKDPVEPPPDPQPQPVEREMGSMGTTGLIAMGLGGAMVVTGGVFGLLASGDKDDLSSEFDPVEKPKLRDSAESNALTADILYIAGGVALTTGIVLFLMDEGEPVDKGQTGPTTTLSPWFSPHGAGANVSVTWGR